MRLVYPCRRSRKDPERWRRGWKVDECGTVPRRAMEVGGGRARGTEEYAEGAAGGRLEDGRGAGADLFGLLLLLLRE